MKKICEDKMKTKYTGIIIFLCLLNSALYSQENTPSNFGHRITIGNYNSYWEDDIGVIEGGYDFIFNSQYITPEYNIADFGIGLSGLFAFDKIGNPRQPVLGLGVNGSMRIYTPTLRKTRVFIEGIVSLVVYSEEFPQNGTIVNGDLHVGGGIDYNIEDTTKLFAKILWFHTSNNDVKGRERNPSVNAVGIAVGVQL